ncbi:unnamed protein product [Prorocentrum cordatum]|uniref:Peptidyl-prolyl cis-trans isomerase n=1 Tax=Prorocentrum cordatum TaxID=2364126 RepID=A0ABN9XU58_9DINO|nr:unnamed protein product [Polarella glacialis]|mmetsp:Transcript_21828/g.56946  ORF Transcript_21828/g.56946 Transcript_21828/m.56946 type:complete len:120 (+) Transcript_21828:61-420(+)
MSKVSAYHLLIKHEGSRNPVSRRTGQSTSGKSKDKAHEELNKLLGQLNGLSGEALKEEFKKLAQAHSDCGSFRQGGDLGEFGKGDMQKQFEDGTYALSVGGLSGIVDSDSGSHLILRYA